MGIGAVILAAGGSSRMGTPKQLLRFDEESLLRRAARAALEAHCAPVIVVVGASADLAKREVADLAAIVVENCEWRSGMASSVRAGVRGAVVNDPQLEAIVVLLCDQPHVTPAVVENLMAAHRRTAAKVVASSYGSTFGVPALFGRRLFEELTRLESASGAKQLIAEHSSDVVFVAFAGGEIDVDTPADYARLLAQQPTSRLATES